MNRTGAAIDESPAARDRDAGDARPYTPAGSCAATACAARQNLALLIREAEAEIARGETFDEPTIRADLAMRIRHADSA